MTRIVEHYRGFDICITDSRQYAVLGSAIIGSLEVVKKCIDVYLERSNLYKW